jgi:hypothetical protein
MMHFETLRVGEGNFALTATAEYQFSLAAVQRKKISA